MNANFTYPKLFLTRVSKKNEKKSSIELIENFCQISNFASFLFSSYTFSKDGCY